MVRHLSLALAILSALGLAAAPGDGIGTASGGSEAASALVTGTVLLVIAAAARRAPHARK